MVSSEKTNIVLIGMAGAGKSSVGAALSGVLGLPFVDVDVLIEQDQRLPLQQVLTERGLQGFRAVEEKVLLSLEYKGYVIATGGSAIYSRAGIEHLKQSGFLVLLDVSLDLLEERVGDFGERGLVKESGQSFAELYRERLPLYRKYADLVVPCSGRSLAEICRFLQDWWQGIHDLQ